MTWGGFVKESKYQSKTVARRSESEYTEPRWDEEIRCSFLDAFVTRERVEDVALNFTPFFSSAVFPGYARLFLRRSSRSPSDARPRNRTVSNWPIDIPVCRNRPCWCAIGSRSWQRCRGALPSRLQPTPRRTEMASQSCLSSPSPIGRANPFSRPAAAILSVLVLEKSTLAMEIYDEYVG
jgi:hypothetical protein